MFVLPWSYKNFVSVLTSPFVIKRFPLFLFVEENVFKYDGTLLLLKHRSKSITNYYRNHD